MCEVDEDIEHAEIAFFESNLKGLHVKPVARQNAAVISPAGIGGRATPTSVCAVDHVVMNQRGAVKKFHDSGEFDGAATVGLTA